jgi:gamma-glutamyltranspeptidase/glutathione hydrolase
MNLQEAGDAGRIRHSGSSQPTGSSMREGGQVHLESGFSEAVRAALAAKGHSLGSSKGGFGGYQAILWDERQGVYYGASEVRKDGQAAGY